MTAAARPLAAPGARFLDPTVLARIGNLELLARTVVEGFVTGLHRSAHFGVSTDFAEHRPYVAGDDTRRVDWRLWARTDRYYVKEYEAETNASCTVLLDVSRSMAWSAGGRVPKLDYARYLAACLLYFAHRQRDRVGLVTFDVEVRDYVPPSGRHLMAALYAIDRAEAAGAGSLARPLGRVTEQLRRPGIVALVSDLYEEPAVVRDAVQRLRTGGSDVIVFHVLDAAEREFPYDGPAPFQDVESGTRMPVVPEYLRDQYRRLVAEHIDTLGRLLGEAGADYRLLDTRRPLDEALFEFLSARQRLSRVR
ncbi:MAG TPA: DUF58 domain-containing protein [Gemmatimonadaceae bacterium]|nr:DUF58 domain-containing protein [Gemmatimonadaceae bacterium]